MSFPDFAILQPQTWDADLKDIRSKTSRVCADDTACCSGSTCMHRTTAALLYVYNMLLVLMACAQATGTTTVLVQGRSSSMCFHMHPSHSQAVLVRGLVICHSQILQHDRRPVHACRHCVSLGCHVLDRQH